MQIGAIIEEGAVDWQIIQQVHGNADIDLSGSWASEEKLDAPRVFVRVVREDSGDRVISWQPGECTESGKWHITVKDVPAGGLYRIETCLNQGDVKVMEWSIRGDMIHHIGVGDLFVIAGQSNSAGYGKDPVYDPPEIGIHIYKNSGKWDLATHPLKLPFTVEDEKGFAQIKSYEQKNVDAITLIINRKLEGKSQVYGAFEQNPKTVVPVDFETHLPFVSFYGVEIED